MHGKISCNNKISFSGFSIIMEMAAFELEVFICLIEVMRPTVSLRNCKLSEAFLRTIEIRLREMNVVE